MSNVLVDRWNRTLSVLRDQFEGWSKTHPTDRIELYTAAEPCPVPENRRRDLGGIIRSAVVCYGTAEEDLEGYWIFTGGDRFAVRYLGDRAGRDEFVRVMEEFEGVVATNKKWDAARSLGLAAFICYLGLWRPMPLLRCGFVLLDLKATSPADKDLLEKHGGMLDAIQLILSHGIFVAARSALDWIIDPTAVLRLPRAVNYPLAKLPGWEAMRGLFEELKDQADGSPVAEAELAEPARPATDGLIIDRFFVERDGKRCDLGNTMQYKLIAFLHEHLNKFVSVADTGEGVWGNDMVETDTIKKTARNANKMLKAAKLRGVAIDTSQADYVCLVVT